MSHVLLLHIWNLSPLLFWLLLLFFHSSFLSFFKSRYFFFFMFVIIVFLVWKNIAYSTGWIQIEICPFQWSANLFKTLKYLFCINEVEDKQVMYFLVKEQNRDIGILKRLIVALICRFWGTRRMLQNICDPLPTPTTTNRWGLREDITSKNLAVPDQQGT